MDIGYRIIEVNKINTKKYEVLIDQIVSGIEYPRIPYDVVLEDGEWKFDNTSVVIYPKEVLRAKTMLEKDRLLDYFNQQELVSENEGYYVVKTEKSNKLSLLGSLSYSFNQQSTDIYSSGSLDIYTYPGSNDEDDDENNYLYAELFDEDPSNSVFVDSDFLDAFTADSTSFSCNGYHSVKVKNYNYPWLTGTYYVYY